MTASKLSAKVTEASPPPLGPWARMVGETSHSVRVLPRYMDENGNVVAFKQFVQYAGPQVAYYDARDGRYCYQVFSWQSDDPAKIIARLEGLAAAIAASGAHTIVWRTKPEFIEDGGRSRFYCRFHVLPYAGPLAGEKPEGEMTPEA